MTWSAVKKRMWAEKRRLAELLAEETDANMKNLSEDRVLASRVFEIVRGADQLQLFGEETARHMERTYEKVATINDAMAKYLKFKSSPAGDPDFEKKTSEFEQFLAWYRGGLAATLLSFRERLQEEMKGPPAQEMMESKGAAG